MISDTSKALAKRFKKLYVDVLKSLYDKGDLEFAGTAMSVSSKKGFKALIRKHLQKEWVVYSKAPFGGPECENCFSRKMSLEHIGQYTHRVAITNNHIVSLKEGVNQDCW